MHRLRSSPRSGGFSLVEILVVFTVLTVAVGFMARSVGTVGRLGPANRETARALDAARAMAEEIRAGDFSRSWFDYNDDAADDPDGPGTSPGAGFEAIGLDVRAGDPDGFVGRIEFPTAGGELREDVVDVQLGMPRDLNGDGVVDALDHAGDYEVLPFRVVIEWTGRSGDRSARIHTTMVRP